VYLERNLEYRHLGTISTSNIVILQHQASPRDRGARRARGVCEVAGRQRDPGIVANREGEAEWMDKG